MSTPSCQSDQPIHRGDVMAKYGFGNALIGYLCEDHYNTTPYCYNCKQFLDNGDFIDPSTGVCIPDMLSDRCYGTLSARLNKTFVNKTDYNAFTLSQSTINQTNANLATSLAATNTRLTNLVTSLQNAGVLSKLLSF